MAKFHKKVINGLPRIFRTNERTDGRTDGRTELMKTIVLPEKSRGTKIMMEINKIDKIISDTLLIACTYSESLVLSLFAKL